MTEPLRVVFEVACPPAHAFHTWTAGATAWWPTDHTVSGEPGAELHFEPWVGGRVFERSPSGREVDWGEVATWDPPRRIAYLWHLGTDRSQATDVDVAFDELPNGSTRVEIVHGGWERVGAAGPSRRDANSAGWAGVVPLYVQACSGNDRTKETGRRVGPDRYTVLAAGRLADATEMAKGCPILASGGTVEVYETFEIM